MHLLRDVLRKWQSRYADGFNPGEREQVGGLDLVRRRRERISEPDVDDELIEDAAGELGGDVKPNRPKVVGVVEGVRSDRGEGKEVVEGESRNGGKTGCGG